MSRRPKRDDFGQFTKGPSKKMLLGSWLGALLSVALMYGAALAVFANFGSFRSCSANDGRVLTDCGKHGINFGDLMIILIFVLTSFMAVSLATHAFRVTKRMFP